MSDVGSLAWARRSGGRVSFGDRLTLARQATALLVRSVVPMFAYRSGLQRRFPPDVDLASLRAPDTTAARAAEQELEDLTPPFMVNHSLRTYWFSRLLGETAALSYDDEVLYVASLLHDIGFYGGYAKATPQAECFAVRGANAALELAEAHAWETSRGERAAETICLHVNGTTTIEAGAEAYLMQRGVMLDVTGLHAWALSPRDVGDVFERHPRLEQHEKLWPLFRDEANAQRRCRGFFAKRWLGFGLLVRLVPWR